MWEVNRTTVSYYVSTVDCSSIGFAFAYNRHAGIGVIDQRARVVLEATGRENRAVSLPVFSFISY